MVQVANLPPGLLGDASNGHTKCKVCSHIDAVFPEDGEKKGEKYKKQAHLQQYLHLLADNEFGLPEFHEKLDRKLGNLKDPNLIYPVSEDIFIHIYPNPNDIRDYYIAVEPHLLEPLDWQLEAVEVSLIDYIEVLKEAEDREERVLLLYEILKRIITVKKGAKRKDTDDGEGGGGDDSLVGRLASIFGGEKDGKGSSGKSLVMTPSQFRAMAYVTARNITGLGMLEPMVQDAYIEDISCSGLGDIFVEHKVFGSLKSNLNFDTHETLDKFVIQLSEAVGRPVTYKEPAVDATLPDGSRINIVFGTDVSKRGSNFTIRKFTETPLSILELIEFHSISYEMSAYLSLCLQEGMNIFVCGETASGKTTLLNALTTFLPPDFKVVTIEDTPEVQIPHPNWIREQTRMGAQKEGAAGIGMFDLLKAALRQRPNEIIIGEIRGEEGLIAFQAMQTGHACMSTFHAATPVKLIQRLSGDPINVPKAWIDNLNIVVIQSAVKLPNGKLGRRAISISEIVGYDSATQSFAILEAFTWNPATDEFLFRAEGNSYVMEEKIAFKRGLANQDKRNIYNEISKRAKILKRLHNKGVTNFNDLFRVLSKAYKDGQFR